MWSIAFGARKGNCPNGIVAPFETREHARNYLRKRGWMGQDQFIGIPLPKDETTSEVWSNVCVEYAWILPVKPPS